jgi:hypothetical protein
MPSYTRLKGVTDVSQSTLCDQLESNIIEFFNWGMLCIGGFNNVQIGAASGAYGGDMSRLRPVSDPNYINGQVWEGFRQDWVWQSGIEYVVQPIPVSGVYINSVFYPLNTTGVYSILCLLMVVRLCKLIIVIDYILFKPQTKIGFDK